MTIFNDDQQQKLTSSLREKEEEELVQTLASTKYNIPYIDLTKVMIENSALSVVPETLAKSLGIAPFDLKGKELSLGVRSPERKEVVEFIDRLKGKGYKIELYMVSSKGVEKVIGRYEEISSAERVKAGSLDISPETLSQKIKEIKTIQDVEAQIKKTGESSQTHRITKILEVLFAGAISLGVSDVHIEPEDDVTKIRFRLDGVLHTIIDIDHQTYWLINSRIKLLSGMKLTKGRAQDGRFSIFIEGAEISMRTSIMPGAYGEGVVMRILNPQSIEVELEDLGIEPKLFTIVGREIEKPNGMILITGPTGSGKTTTLYSFLRRIKSTENKVITIEDPIEYHLPGITQTQTNQVQDYDFAAGLRAALRHDPDIVMVGEIRDGETANIAVESALTGHLVFSTLHTNNSAGVIPRLIDLGVNSKILSSALSIAIGQRLVRKLCQTCKKEREATEEEKTIINQVLQSAEKDGKDVKAYGIDTSKAFVLYEPQGCEKCNGIGYKGRIGIFEAVLADEAMQNLMPQNPSETEIRKLARTQGILDMKEDGIIKALKGVSSIQEIKSVVDIYEDVDYKSQLKEVTEEKSS
jgi:type II secretory ATPase GspE/PulE/Tfp pilus assembly ATPase PilB-like protein